MSNFTPSPQFNARWLATPAIIKHIIYDELDDIKSLLQEQVLLEDFSFRHVNLDLALAPLQKQHLIQERANLYAQKQQEAAVLLPNLQAEIDQKIAQKKAELDEKLEQYKQSLYAWAKQQIDNAVESYKPD